MGASALLPNNDIGNFASGVVGSLAGGVGGAIGGSLSRSRTQARTRQQQNRIAQEQQALLEPDDAAISSLSASRMRGRGQRLRGQTGISNITNQPPRQQPSTPSTMQNIMTKAKQALEYGKTQVANTAAAIKGRIRTRGGKYQKVPTDDTLQETKTTPMSKLSIEEPTEATSNEATQRQVGANIHTLNTGGDGTVQMLQLRPSPPIPTDEAAPNPFGGEGRRASGKMSMGTAIRRKQEDLAKEVLKANLKNKQILL